MSLTDQINAVITYANRNGLPDARDWIMRKFHNRDFTNDNTEPPLEDKVTWIRWHREMHGSLLKDALAEYDKRRED